VGLVGVWFTDLILRVGLRYGPVVQPFSGLVTVVPCKLEKNHRATIKRTEGEIGTNILVLVNKK
jgi:hypothetical protein